MKNNRLEISKHSWQQVAKDVSFVAGCREGTSCVTQNVVMSCTGDRWDRWFVGEVITVKKEDGLQPFPEPHFRLTRFMTEGMAVEKANGGCWVGGTETKNFTNEEVA
ncbi:hypothetical protein N9Y98_02670 [Candidatus Pelagibacter bacterium]|nr:hypothetical protein [Candidatus Pelagibacter bacterium]